MHNDWIFCISLCVLLSFWSIFFSFCYFCLFYIFCLLSKNQFSALIFWFLSLCASIFAFYIGWNFFIVFVYILDFKVLKLFDFTHNTIGQPWPKIFGTFTNNLKRHSTNWYIDWHPSSCTHFRLVFLPYPVPI